MAGGTARRRSLATLACRNFTSCWKAQRSITCLTKRSPSALASFRMLIRKNRPPPITAMTIIIKTSACPRWPDCGRGIALLLRLSDEELVIFRDKLVGIVVAPLCRGVPFQHHGDRAPKLTMRSHYEIILSVAKLSLCGAASSASPELSRSSALHRPISRDQYL